mmetsp:Transcript_9704/g.22852  ORF Transcript_9704/g.22852 Transcript_9704/m.22852 type:complete len:181 (-) Transcript_9704:1110-1652(-)
MQLRWKNLYSEAAMRLLHLGCGNSTSSVSISPPEKPSFASSVVSSSSSSSSTSSSNDGAFKCLQVLSCFMVSQYSTSFDDTTYQVVTLVFSETVECTQQHRNVKFLNVKVAKVKVVEVKIEIEIEGTSLCELHSKYVEAILVSPIPCLVARVLQLSFLPRNARLFVFEAEASFAFTCTQI